MTLHRFTNHINEHDPDHEKKCREACCLNSKTQQPDYTPKLGKKHADEDTLSGHVSVTFDLTDERSTPMDVDVRASLDNGMTFVNCTPAPDSESTRRMASCPHGTRHEFVWNTLADLGADGSYEDVLILVLAHGRGGTVLGPVRIDNSHLEDDDLEAAA